MNTNCKLCGGSLPEGAATCPSCGSQAQNTTLPVESVAVPSLAPTTNIPSAPNAMPPTLGASAAVPNTIPVYSAVPPSYAAPPIQPASYGTLPTQPTPYGAMPAPYGAQPYQPGMPSAPIYPIQAPAPTKKSIVAIISLVLGILGVVLFWFTEMIWSCLIMSFVAIITGIVATSQMKTTPSLSGKGMAIIGIITGILGILGFGFFMWVASMV